MPILGYAHRPVAYGRDGLVASAHPAATLAGLDVLRAGGNVVDASIAVNATLAVVQPHMCGLGGDLFVLYFHAPSSELCFLNAAGRSGSRATPEALRQRGLDAVPIQGPLAVSVPGAVAGWGALADRFGSRPLAELLKPAVTLASDGFPVSDLLAQTITERAPLIEDPEWHRIYAPGGEGPRTGAVLRQPDLGRSLARLAAEGPEAFYQGEVAGRIVEHVAVGGGFLTRDDLARHAARWQRPISTTYRDCTVFQTPPPTQGFTLLQALNLVETFDVASLSPQSPDHLHVLVEALKLAYADRDRYLGDPDHVPVPLATLLDKTYAATRRARLHRRRAARMTVSGELLSDTVSSFSLDPGSPSVLAPGKQPLHTLVASLVLRDRQPVVALATMGGHGQPQTHLQILVNLLDFKMDPQEAIERPRVIQGKVRPTDPGDRLRVEGRVPARTVATLRRRGHLVDLVPDRAVVMGHAHVLTVEWTAAGPVLAGGADPRGDGLALGF